MLLKLQEIVFVAPKAKPIEPIKSQKPASFDSVPSTSSGYRGKNSQKNSAFNHKIPQSQMIASSDLKKEIMESTQAIMFDDFESEIKNNSVNSTFRNRQDISSNNIVFISGTVNQNSIVLICYSTIVLICSYLMTYKYICR